MEKDTKHNMTVKDTVGVALTAYIVVKAAQGLSSVAVTTVQGFRARKENKKLLK